MSDISSIGYGSVGPLNQPGSNPSYHRNGTAPASAESTSASAKGRDRVELSEHARLMDKLRELPPIRSEKVEAVRQAIAEGKYETSERIDIAVQRLVEDLF